MHIKYFFFICLFFKLLLVLKADQKKNAVNHRVRKTGSRKRYHNMPKNTRIRQVNPFMISHPKNKWNDGNEGLFDGENPRPNGAFIPFITNKSEKDFYEALPQIHKVGQNSYQIKNHSATFFFPNNKTLTPNNFDQIKNNDYQIKSNLENSNYKTSRIFRHRVFHKPTSNSIHSEVSKNDKLYNENIRELENNKNIIKDNFNENGLNKIMLSPANILNSTSDTVENNYPRIQLTSYKILNDSDIEAAIIRPIQLYKKRFQNDNPAYIGENSYKKDKFDAFLYYLRNIDKMARDERRKADEVFFRKEFNNIYNKNIISNTRIT